MNDKSIAFNLNNGSGLEKCVAEYEECCECYDMEKIKNS